MSKTGVHVIYAGTAVAITALLAGSYAYVSIHNNQLMRQAAVTPPVTVQAAAEPPSRPSQSGNVPAMAPALSPDQLAQTYNKPVPTIPAAAFNDPQASAQILDIISKLAFVEGKTRPVAGQQYAYVFFDPRCPYCHKAYEELDAKLPIRWVPIPLLGDNPVPLVAALLNNPTAAELDKAFNGRLPEPAVATADHQRGLLGNVTAFKTFMDSLNGEGVPILLIPRANGTIYGQIGYTAGDVSKISAEYGV